MTPPSGLDPASADKGVCADALGDKEMAQETFEHALQLEADLKPAPAGYCIFLRNAGLEAEAICSRAQKGG